MRFFAGIDPLLIIPGAQPIVVAAPHHGTRPRANSDLATGPIAQRLSGRLNARVIIVSDMRGRVDVNKNPLGLPGNVRHHALRYQDAVFDQLPRLIIEIHGQASGTYPIEISPGFDLDPGLPGDAAFLERLRKLKHNLPDQLGRIGVSAAVGIYPLDRDIRKFATNTYTFQKIRRARKRVGLEWYGLHIELAASLRTSSHARESGYADSLAVALGAAIQSAFDPLPGPTAYIPIPAEIDVDELVSGRSWRVIKAPEDSIGRAVVILHPQELDQLDALEGDLVCLGNHGESLRVPASTSLRIAPGRIAIPALVRNQLDLAPGGRVVVRRVVPATPPVVSGSRHAFVIAKVGPGNGLQLWMHPHVLERMRGHGSEAHFCSGPFPSVAPVPVQLLAEENTPERTVSASDGLMKKLTLSLGDTITIGTGE